MTEFDTLEKVQNLFQNINQNKKENNYFIVYKDTSTASVASGGALVGIVNGMEYPYDALLINQTEEGLAMILLEVEGITLNFVKIEKLHLRKNEHIFIKNKDIQDIKIKKYALLNSSKKKITIKTKDNRVYNLYANVNEPLLPYHNESFAKFINQYS